MAWGGLPLQDGPCFPSSILLLLDHSRPPPPAPSIMTTPHSIHGKSKTPVPDVLQVHSFPYHVLMGDWMIVGSSLKLWKNRSDVLCRYTPHSVPTPEKQAELRQSAKTTDPVSFSDEIWWEQLDKKGGHQKGKGAPREKQSIVRGKNKIDPKGVNG